MSATCCSVWGTELGRVSAQTKEIKHKIWYSQLCVGYLHPKGMAAIVDHARAGSLSRGARREAMWMDASARRPGLSQGRFAGLMVGALGVVYGDIGTSPLYTFKTALDWAGGTATPDVAMGMLSLIVWTLFITTSLKYVAFVMQADNDGEGGILALMSLLGQRHGSRLGVLAVGLLGAALLYGDGAITPAISVLSALEGLKIPMPSIAPYIVPMATVILVSLFAIQPRGTAWIGRLFGPIMVVWFVVIGLLGLMGIAHHPGVLAALNPSYGIAYLVGHGFSGFLVLGAVFLCATGAEALYADMGHFGLRPIRTAWYGLVLPMLLLNYAGQTAEVVAGSLGKDDNPFFMLCPDGLRIPLVLLSTVATIIASQAIISGAFSMTRQAIQLGLCPRLNIVQTSEDGYGQIYVGFVNWVLMCLTVVLTLSFRSSDALAAAFGIAVSMTMLLTSVLMLVVMRELWGWGRPAAYATAGLFAVVDLSFVVANMMKVFEGGWVPLVVAGVIFLLLWTWRSGRRDMLAILERETMSLNSFISSMRGKPRVPGTAIYLTSRTDVVPVPLLHNLKHNRVLHERIVLLHVVTDKVPRVPADERFRVSHLEANFHAIEVRDGFMETPNLPRVLEGCRQNDLDDFNFDMMQTSFFVGRLKIVSKSAGWRRFSCSLFEVMHRNALAATEFFGIPPGRVVELGGQIEI